MATKFERGLFKTVTFLGAVIGSYIVSIAIYTIIYGNGFWYNFGYSVGWITQKMGQVF